MWKKLVYRIFTRRVCGCVPLSIFFLVFILVSYFMSATVFQAKLGQEYNDFEGLKHPALRDIQREPNLRGNDTLKVFPTFDDMEQGKVYDPRKYHRIVHFDLKGAPPSVQYMREIFPLLRKLGATGLLMEYEDMFPYWGELSILARHDAYNISSIKEIIKLAHENKLIVIPLVQTFGHFEFVLKHNKFKYLREVPDRIQNLNPALEDSMRIVSMMLDQVLSLHPESQYIHIGCDEVRSLGISPESGKLMKEKGMRTEDLFLYHVINVLNHVRGHYPGVVSLMWDDMLRRIESSKLKKHDLGSLVEPMVWLYVAEVRKRFTAPFWANLATVFKSVWTASSFKGATGQAQYVVEVGYHVSNNAAWGKVMERVHKAHFPDMTLRGIVLTGWQRYDHVLPLCELFPVGFPSLAVNLHVLIYGGTDIRAYELPAKILNCAKPIPLRLPKTENDLVKCSFPGSDIYDAVNELRLTRLGIDTLVKRGVSNDPKHDLIKQRTLHHINHLPAVLLEIYGQDTVREFMELNLLQPLSKLSDIKREAQDLMGHHYPWLRPPRQI